MSVWDGYKDWKELASDISKDRIMKLLLRIILGAFCIGFVLSLFLYFKDGYEGKHVRMLFGLLERNVPKDHPDTIFVNREILIHDTTKITKYIKTSSPIIKSPDTSRSSSKYQIQNPTFNGPAQIGDNNKQYNFGPIQPHPDKQVVKNIENIFPNKQDSLILGYDATSQASKNYLNELWTLLKQSGYSNIYVNALMGTGFDEKGVFLKVLFGQKAVIVALD